MKWRAYLCSVLFVFFALAVGSAIINAKNNVFATDYTFTFTAGSSSDTVLCDSSGSGNLPYCHDIKFISIENSQSIDVQIRPSFSFSNNGTDCNSSTSSVIYPLILRNSTLSYSYTSFSSICSIRFGSSYSWNNQLSGTVLNFTLSTELPGSSEPCPVCPICPEIPENPYDNKLDDIKHAILIIPATILVLYFFYCIYRMLLKGRV